MNPFMLAPSERLAEWRNFRQSLEGLSESDQLEAVATWFAQAPMSTFVLDFDNVASWPSPWDLINEGDFDTTAVAYLMEQTLILAGWEPSRLRLHFVRNQKIQDQMMILLVDDKLALNYVYGDVFNFDNERSDCAYLVSYQPDNDGGHTEL